MDRTFRDCLWKNFGAAIDMLKNAIIACPDELWKNEKRFFYLSYHTVIFLDYYSTNPVKNFQPGLPYTIINQDSLPEDAVDDVIPDLFYSKEEFLACLSSVRGKCKNLVTLQPAQLLQERWITADEINMHGLCPPIVENYSVLEILFYNFRHVQHHVAQLNFILRQEAGIASPWISHAD